MWRSSGGILIPAHIFTPHKGLYGSCADSLAEVLDPAKIMAVELGLSANTAMADRLSELQDKTFLTNSDAHSLGKIGREYQSMRMRERSYREWEKAIRRQEGRGVAANYGCSRSLASIIRRHARAASRCCRRMLRGDVRNAGTSGSCGEWRLGSNSSPICRRASTRSIVRATWNRSRSNSSRVWGPDCWKNCTPHSARR